MAKDVKFLIAANVDRAEAEIRKLQSTGQAVSDSLSRSFEALGIKSSDAFEKKRQAAQNAYDRIKSSGQATNDELVRAQQALAQKLIGIDEEQYGKRTSLMDKFKANWLGVTAAIGAAWMGISKAWDLATEAAKGQQQRQSFANLTASYGQSAQSIIASLRAVSGETISTRVMVEKAGTAMLLGIPADKLAGLMEIARASSKMTGQSITDAFGDISLAVGRSSRMILDNLGIIVSEEAANKQYAAQLGKTSEQLTDTEKKTAFLNATLAAGKDIINRVGDSGETMSEKMERVNATLANMKELVGTGVLAAMLALNGVINMTAGAASSVAASIFRVTSAAAWLVGATAQMQEFNIMANAAWDAAGNLVSTGWESMGDATDLLSGKLDPLNSKMTAFSNKAKEAADATEKLAEAKRTASENLTAYAKEIERLGELQLKAAGSGFTEDLKKQAEYLKNNNQLATNMSAPMQQYLGVVDQVYGAQLDMQKQIGQALFRIGAEQKTIAQQNVTIAQTEKASASARLDAWTQYYDNLRNMHTTTMADMKKSQADLMNMQMATGDLVAQIKQKMMTPMEQYYDQVRRLEEKQKLAAQMTGDEKIRILQQVQQSWSGLSNEITDGDQVLLDKTKAAGIAINKITEIGKQMEQEKASQINQQQEALAVLEDAMKNAGTMVSEYQAKIQELDNTIAALSRTFSLTMKDEASPAIRAVKSELDQIRDKTVTITAHYVSTYSNSGSDYGIPSYDVGTPYVPRTGLALIHKGERIITARDNAAGNTTNSTAINAGGITINIQGGGTSTETAREIARKVLPELQQLQQRYRKVA